MISISHNPHLVPLKSVYCYYFPEVRQIITDITSSYPHDTFLQSVYPGLDDIHIPLIDKYKKYFSDQISGLDSFPFQYITSGASEGIFHILAEIKSHTPNLPVYTLIGEYEGFAGYAKNLGLNTQSIDPDSDWSKFEKGIVFLSNPSARDGNHLPKNLIDHIAKGDHQIVLDLTYLGLTSPQKIDISHPSITKIITSLSKPFGLYYYRIGFTFSKNPMPTLAPNKWFKNILSILIAEQVLDQIPAYSLVNKYRPYQQRAVSEISSQFLQEISPSDVLLLAHLPKPGVNSSPNLEIFDRTSNYRFCLTPYFLKYEHEQK